MPQIEIKSYFSIMLAYLFVGVERNEVGAKIRIDNLE